MYRSDVDKFFHWDKGMQRYSPQWWRADMQPQWLYFDRNDTADPKVVLAAPGTTPISTFRVSYSSNQGADNYLGNPLEVRALVFEDSTDTTAAADWTVRLKQVGEVRELMNNPVHVRTLFGTAQFPMVLREPLFIPSQGAIEAQLQKVAGGNANIRMYLEGCQYFTWSPDLLTFPKAREHLQGIVRKWMNRRRSVHPYWMTTPGPVALAGGATARVTMRPGEGSQFEAFTLSSISTGNYLLEIKEVRTGQTLMNGQVTRNNAVGNNLLPTILPSKWLIPGGHYLSLRFTDLSAAPNSIYLTIGGRKIYAPIKDAKEALEGARGVPTPADKQVDFALSPY